MPGWRLPKTRPPSFGHGASASPTIPRLHHQPSVSARRTQHSPQRHEDTKVPRRRIHPGHLCPNFVPSCSCGEPFARSTRVVAAKERRERKEKRAACFCALCVLSRLKIRLCRNKNAPRTNPRRRLQLRARPTALKIYRRTVRRRCKAAPANASTPKTAAYVAGSGTAETTAVSVPKVWLKVRS
jgi:hypothetical protein